jgi:hypothetical protein
VYTNSPGDVITTLPIKMWKHIHNFDLTLSIYIVIYIFI